MSSEQALEQQLRRHAESQRVVHDLESCIARTADPVDDWVPRLQGCFVKFATVIRSQLEREERGSLYRELPTRSPRLANRITRLGREHRRIRDELDLMTGRVGALARAPDAVTEVRGRVLQLVTDLKSLEDKETELLQSAYWRETGVGD